MLRFYPGLNSIEFLGACRNCDEDVPASNKSNYFYLLQDCERRRVAKLFRHRSDERRNTHQVEIN